MFCAPREGQGLPVEHDQNNSTARREPKKTMLGKAIRLELAIFKSANRVLIFLGIAVERGEVQIRGRLGNAEVTMVRLEEICEDI